MSYRDELEAAQARSEALERELAEARDKIAALESGSTALVKRGDGTLAPADADKPKPTLTHERTFEGSLSDASLAEIAEHLSETAPLANQASELTVMTGSILWKGMRGSYQQSIRVSSRRGNVIVKMETNIAAMGVGAGFLGMLGGGLATSATAAVAAALAAPPALGFLAFIPVAWYLKRRAHRRFFRKQVKLLDDRFAELVELVESLIELPEDGDSPGGDRVDTLAP